MLCCLIRRRRWRRQPPRRRRHLQCPIDAISFFSFGLFGLGLVGRRGVSTPCVVGLLGCIRLDRIFEDQRMKALAAVEIGVADGLRFRRSVLKGQMRSSDLQTGCCSSLVPLLTGNLEPRLITIA